MLIPNSEPKTKSESTTHHSLSLQKGMILKQHSVLSETKDAPEISMFVGTSPELEMALYTLCFMARPDRPCKLRYNNVQFTIQTKTLKADNVLLIDTAYPIY